LVADVVFSFASQSGQSYNVQFMNSFGSGTWRLLTNLIGNSGFFTVTHHNPSIAVRFCRIEAK